MPRYQKDWVVITAGDAAKTVQLGFRAYGVSVSNLTAQWVQIDGAPTQWISPNSRASFSLGGQTSAQVSFSAPPGTTQNSAVTGQQAVCVFTEEPLPDVGGPLALGMNNPMASLGDIIIAAAQGVATRLGIGTTGQVLTVVAGQPAWAAASGTISLVQDILLAIDTPTFDFTGIAATQGHLMVYVNARCDTAATNDYVSLRFNNDSGANYNYDYVHFASGGTAGGGDNSTGVTQAKALTLAGNTAAASASAVGIIHIPDFAATTFHKSYRGDGTVDINVIGGAGGGILKSMAGGKWGNTAAISRVTLKPHAGGNFKSGSRATLYRYNVV